MNNGTEYNVQNFLETLNPPQYNAATSTEGPMMIIAGAGSGKTKVITYRIAYLMQNGVDPFSILALTFTNKAAKEMKERIEKIVGSSKARNLWMGTFHSVFAKILRIEAEKLGFPSNFTIYDTDDSKSLIKSVIKDLKLDDKQYKPGLVYNRISAAKNNLISWRAYNSNDEIQLEDKASQKPQLGNIYKMYQQRLFQSSAMDFDDLLFNTNILFRDFPEVLLKYQHKFKYVMVDEYQDTNFSQYVIVKKLAALNENICVVGDDAQSIYAFRGANIQNILNFRKDYPDLKVFKLEQNYRSTKIIVKAANSIISNNKQQLKKDVWTENDIGEKIDVIRAFTDNEEGQVVASSIFDTQMNAQAQHKDFAILYRTNAQSRAMEEALRRQNIPYKIYGGLSFYKRQEIKDLLAYCRLAINHQDEESLKRIINYPARGIGDTTMDKIAVAALTHNIPMWEVLNHPAKYQVGVNQGAITKLHDFAEMIKSFAAIANTHNAYDAGLHIAMQSGLTRELYNDKTPEGVNRYENIQELLNGMKEFTENDVDDLVVQEDENQNRLLRDYMQNIALLTDDNDDKDGDFNKVSLMTIHSAKGLEFPYVYIVGVEENLFPSQLSINSSDELEEERRLFYVAVTRAEKRATITFATSRYKFGTLNSCEQSRFINEIDSDCLNFKFGKAQSSNHDFFSDFDFNESKEGWGNQYKPREQASSRKPVYQPPTVKTSPKPAFTPPKNLTKLSSASVKSSNDIQGDDTRNLTAGQAIEHIRFGKGIVELVEGIYPNQKATINFEEAGKKQLILKFAKIKILLQ
jgi:DNA helicase-2/ATP-dependent DNA helicase PcrA